MHYFEFHFQKIIAATKGWRDDEFGAYVRLLIEQFDRGYVPDDPAELSRLITTYKKNWPLLKKKFTEPSEAGQLRNSFMCVIRGDALERSAKNSIAGKIGVEKKKRLKSERLSNAEANAESNDEQSHKRGLSQPVTSNQEPVSNSLKEKVAVLPERQRQIFEMFRRCSPSHLTDNMLIAEVGKFENKYGHLHIHQCGPVINTWVSNIGKETSSQDIEQQQKRMVN